MYFAGNKTRNSSGGCVPIVALRHKCFSKLKGSEGAARVEGHHSVKCALCYTSTSQSHRGEVSRGLAQPGSDGGGI